jgi:hypothetical protein
MTRSTWGVVARALAVTCVAAAFMWIAWPAKAEQLCVPVKILAAKRSETGEVATYPGADLVHTYAAAIGYPIPPEVNAIGMILYDAGGVAVAAGIIEAGDCVRFTVVISRDRHLAGVAAMGGI